MYSFIVISFFLLLSGQMTSNMSNDNNFCNLVSDSCSKYVIHLRSYNICIENKSKLKISIIQGIDRKIALDELAESKGLEFDELLDEVEAIVYSGTKINIDYFLDEVMDEDHLDDIFEYFKESESDDLELAINELGGDYTEEEIRLVRIKFISEMGN